MPRCHQRIGFSFHFFPPLAMRNGRRGGPERSGSYTVDGGDSVPRMQYALYSEIGNGTRSMMGTRSPWPNLGFAVCPGRSARWRGKQHTLTTPNFTKGTRRCAPHVAGHRQWSRGPFLALLGVLGSALSGHDSLPCPRPLGGNGLEGEGGQGCILCRIVGLEAAVPVRQHAHPAFFETFPHGGESP
jgi:hypothetical protein